MFKETFEPVVEKILIARPWGTVNDQIERPAGSLCPHVPLRTRSPHNSKGMYWSLLSPRVAKSVRPIIAVGPCVCANGAAGHESQDPSLWWIGVLAASGRHQQTSFINLSWAHALGKHSGVRPPTLYFDPMNNRCIIVLPVITQDLVLIVLYFFGTVPHFCLIATSWIELFSSVLC